MTCLSDVDIAQAIGNKKFKVEGAVDFQMQIQPASFDLQLGSCLRRIVVGQYDLDYKSSQNQSVFTEAIYMDGSGYLMPSGDFLLAHTIEKITLDNTLRGVLHNKSTPARMGLSVCNDAAFVDPGFSGQLTLQLVNNGPLAIRLRPGVMICQLELSMLCHPCSLPYGLARSSNYQDQVGPQPMRRHKNTQSSVGSSS